MANKKKKKKKKSIQANYPKQCFTETWKKKKKKVIQTEPNIIFIKLERQSSTPHLVLIISNIR